jgi:hypothetical protein
MAKLMIPEEIVQRLERVVWAENRSGGRWVED